MQNLSTKCERAAYTILELDRHQQDQNWLKSQYEENQKRRISQHIRFADYWYAANGQFTDLKKHCRDIAKDAGLKLTPESAFQWLAQGGFTNDILGQAIIGGFDPSSMKQVMQRFSQHSAAWKISDHNIFELNLKNAQEELLAYYTNDGKITPIKCYVRDGNRLPMIGFYELLTKILQQTSDLQQILQQLQLSLQQTFGPQEAPRWCQHALECLEVITNEGWVKAKVDKKKVKLHLETPVEGKLIHTHQPVTSQ